MQDQNIKINMPLVNVEQHAIEIVINEYLKATQKFGSFQSYHEGKAVIEEELDELWELIKNNKNKTKEWNEEVKKEAKQIAAMAIRFLVDLCIKE